MIKTVQERCFICLKYKKAPLKQVVGFRYQKILMTL